MTEELKPCPFCGGTETGIGRYESRRWVVQCYSTDCICEGPHRATKREAIAAWNHRADLAIPKDEADAMVSAAVEKVAEYVFCRCPIGVCNTRDGTCSRRQRENVLSFTSADARAALDRIVQEAENRIISAFRVNMMRLQPDYTHEKFDALIAAIRKGDDQ